MCSDHNVNNNNKKATADLSKWTLRLADINFKIRQLSDIHFIPGWSWQFTQSTACFQRCCFTRSQIASALTITFAFDAFLDKHLRVRGYIGPPISGWNEHRQLVPTLGNSSTLDVCSQVEHLQNVLLRPFIGDDLPLLAWWVQQANQNNNLLVFRKLNAPIIGQHLTWINATRYELKMINWFDASQNGNHPSGPWITYVTLA